MRSPVRRSPCPLRVLIAPLVIAGCGGVTPTAPAARGCPPATAVAMARWDEPGAWPGSARTAGYRVPLGFRWDGDPTAPAPGPLPGYEVAKLGLGPLPPTLWLLRPGLAPCPAQVTGYLTERVDVGPISLAVVATLAGCAPADDLTAPAWVSLVATEPVGCRLETPAPVGARTADTTDGGFVVAPATEDVPAPWAGLDPDELCAGACERLWSVAAIASEPALAAVTISDVGAEGEVCAREAHTRFGIFATPVGQPPVEIATSAVVDLVGALVDDVGARVVLTHGVDTWEAIDVGPDGATGGRRLVQYEVAHEEDGLRHSLGPDCGP